MPNASCLCGQVKITAEEVKPDVSACHCQSCRGWGGGPFLAVQCGTKVQFEGQEHIKEYDSSAWAKRGFCQSCGTHLYFYFKKAEAYNMPVGIFENLEGLAMAMQFYIDKKPDYYCFAQETASMTEAEIMSYYASEL